MKRHWINVKRKRPEKKNLKELTVGEIKSAEHQIIAQAQRERECYHEELNSLGKNKLIQKTSTWLSQTYVDRQFIACGRKSSSFIFTTGFKTSSHFSEKTPLI